MTRAALFGLLAEAYGGVATHVGAASRWVLGVGAAVASAGAVIGGFAVCVLPFVRPRFMRWASLAWGEVLSPEACFERLKADAVRVVDPGNRAEALQHIAKTWGLTLAIVQGDNTHRLVTKEQLAAMAVSARN